MVEKQSMDVDNKNSLDLVKFLLRNRLNMAGYLREFFQNKKTIYFLV